MGTWDSSYNTITMYTHITILLSVCTATLALQCYSCDSTTSNCDATSDKPGDITTCPAERGASCFISQTVGGLGGSTDSITVRRGCSADPGPDKCEEHRAPSLFFTFCNCHGDECNKDWSKAAGPPLQCYTCNSADGEGKCDDSNQGTLMECPINKRKGCYISEASFGDHSEYVRGCIEITNPNEYKCSKVGSNGQNLHYCNCHGKGCNQSWDSAKGSDAGGSGAITAFVSASLLLFCFSVILI